MSVGLKKKIRHQKNNIHIKIMKKIILLLILPLFLTGCPWLPTWVSIDIDNKSHDTVYTSLKYTYEDTFFVRNNSEYSDYMLNPHSSRTLSTRIKGDYDYGKAFFTSSDTICIFIVRYGTIKKYDYEDIRKNNRILARYDLSLQDVEAFDGYFEYPPSQRMIDSGMKIYINPNNPNL